MAGKVTVVTGSSSGIGRAVAASLAGLGAEVWVTSRSLDRARASAEEIGSTTKGLAVAHAVDMGEFQQVRQFADRLQRETPGIDVLIHNAGALTQDRRVTSEGVEATVATHLLGPYLLTQLLDRRLRQGARVLFMSSGGMYTQGLDVDQLEMPQETYRGTVAYARAKRAQVVLVGALARRHSSRLVVHGMHPGWVATPGVSTGIPAFERLMRPLLRSPAEGADTMVWLATSTEAGSSTGKFWHDRRERSTNYLPGTRLAAGEEQRLLAWIEARIGRAEA